MKEHDPRHPHHKDGHGHAREGKAGPMFYPKLFVVIGIVLTLAVILIWTVN